MDPKTIESGEIALTNPNYKVPYTIFKLLKKVNIETHMTISLKHLKGVINILEDKGVDNSYLIRFV